MFFLIIHSVRSIFNVGSLFRTADGVGVQKIFLTGYTPGPDTHPEKIAKTALGAEKSVPWERVKRVGDLVRKLRMQNIEVVALEQSKESVDYRKYKPHGPMALIVGNEVKGISNVAQYADIIIEIPMRGKKESLNVAVACGIAMYELRRKKL